MGAVENAEITIYSSGYTAPSADAAAYFFTFPWMYSDKPGMKGGQAPYPSNLPYIHRATTSIGRLRRGGGGFTAI